MGCLEEKWKKITFFIIGGFKKTSFRSLIIQFADLSAHIELCQHLKHINRDSSSKAYSEEKMDENYVFCYWRF